MRSRIVIINLVAALLLAWSMHLLLRSNAIKSISLSKGSVLRTSLLPSLSLPKLKTLALSSAVHMATNSASPEPRAPLSSPQDSKSPSDTPAAAAATDIQPPLSAAEFRLYNRSADMMEAYHAHFRQTWTTLYTACERNSRPAGMSIRSFLQLAESFCSQLTTHHGIEERYIFPVLARRMPSFRQTDKLIGQHEKIHEGLEVLEEYLRDVRSGSRELKLGSSKGDGSLKEILDGFGAVLWAHLDDEVRELGAENMRKYWSREDMMAMRW